MPTRNAQLIAEAVAVVCPYCGDAQSSPNGSELWLAEDFNRKTRGTKQCQSCEKDINIQPCSKAIFQVGGGGP